MKYAPIKDRRERLDHIRALKMARSAHAYVRGATANFYEWLAEISSRLGVPQGPPIWICGDCHLGNLGPIADREGRVDIEIRDLDQTVIGNPAHDMIRLALSLASAARGSDLPGVVTARMVEAMRAGYLAALGEGNHDDLEEPDSVKVVRRRALSRKWRHLAKERLEDVEPSIPLGKHFWPLSDKERQAVEEAVADLDLSQMLSTFREDGQRTELVDAAYWMKGCSSLGLMRIAAIIAVGKGRGRRHALVDLKEAIEPIAPAAARAVMPPDPAERVVAGATALSPNLGTRIAATHLLDRSLFVRELMPQDLKLEVDQFSRKEAITAAHYLAFVVGRAHARQMNGQDKKAWCGIWSKASSTFDAPSWFWRSVVDLAALHEAAYLEHCQRYALNSET